MPNRRGAKCNGHSWGEMPAGLCRSPVGRPRDAGRADEGALSGGAARSGGRRVLASLVEREDRRGLDSTVNPLDRQSVRTIAADRARAGPYNSDVNVGLPPT
jgi:hypothetical protein